MSHFQSCRRLLGVILAFLLAFSPTMGYAQSVLDLPAVGAMVLPSASFVPVSLCAIKIRPDQPLVFDFIVDSGSSVLSQEELKKESEKLAKYFLASLTIPEKDLWVNLSPYEKDRITTDEFGRTEMGKELLAQDYILKQLTASLIYPEKELGKAFWDRVYSKAREVLGTAELPTSTFNKVWIVPQRAVVYEMNNTAIVGEAHLTVMTEEDYQAMQISSAESLSTASRDDMAVSGKAMTQALKDIILPEIEKEVNTGRNFASLRQVYNALILATWYKENLKDSLLGQVYDNQKKVDGVDAADRNIREKIYQQYIAAYKTGVFNLIKEDADTATGTVMPRQYFSGGVDVRGLKTETRKLRDAAQLPTDAAETTGNLSQVTVALRGMKNRAGDSAMSYEEIEQRIRMWEAVEKETPGDEDVVDARVSLTRVLDDLSALMNKENAAYERAVDGDGSGLEEALLELDRISGYMSRARFLLGKFGGKDSAQGGVDAFLVKIQPLVVSADQDADLARAVSVIDEKSGSLRFNGFKKALNGYKGVLTSFQEFRKKSGAISEAFTEAEAIALSKAVAALADLLRAVNLKDLKTQRKFALYSGPPAGGKGDIWSNFEARYKDLIEKFRLFHIRGIRKGEQQDVTYHYREVQHLRGLEAASRIITTLVNNQDQGLALQSFGDEYVFSGAAGKANVLGLQDVFPGASVYVLEGGFGWFLTLKDLEGYKDIATVFISPFTEEQITAFVKQGSYFKAAYLKAQEIYASEVAGQHLISQADFEKQTLGAGELAKGVPFNVGTRTIRGFKRGPAGEIKAVSAKDPDSIRQVDVITDGLFWASAFETAKRIHKRQRKALEGREGLQDGDFGGKTLKDYGFADLKNYDERASEAAVQIMNRNLYAKVIINGYQPDSAKLREQMSRLTDQFSYTIFNPLAELLPGVNKDSSQETEGVAQGEVVVTMKKSDPAQQQLQQGGINFDPAMLNMKVERTGDRVRVTVDPALIERIKTEGVTGFQPVIINIVPVKALLPALGFNEVAKEPELAGV